MSKQDSALRAQIQALRNQAKARGHEVTAQEEELETKAFVYAPSVNNYSYVYKDILRTALFVLIALILLFIASVKLSTLPQFATIRAALHIARFSL